MTIRNTEITAQSQFASAAPAGTERQRIQAEYQRRATDPVLKRLYSPLNPDALFSLQQRERAVMALLRKCEVLDLSGRKLLDLGCGQGNSILRWLTYGLQPSHCVGIDLMPERVEAARTRLPASVTLLQADASHLPFDSNSFDLITQETVFSSILDSTMKRMIAKEMLRVLRPQGLIVWYDFWLNPTNRQTRGIRPAEIRSLLPHIPCPCQSLGLVVVLARRL